jgi:hypothetical protein
MKFNIALLFLLITSQVFSQHTDQVFDRVWMTASTNIYPVTLRKRFTEDERFKLRRKLGPAPSLKKISEVINPFFKSLGVSHTGFYTKEDEMFHFLKSTFQESNSGFTNLADEYFKRTKESAKIFHFKNRKIGYVHLWTGSHHESAAFLNHLTKSLFKDTDGMILDLRGGHGGAWWEHLVPFFEDTSTFFEATRISPDGSKEVFKLESKKNPQYYSRPMVVMIDAKVTSGKEALAFQFAKTGRAQLVGVRTAGAFVAGKPYFVHEAIDYLLYLSVEGLLLDGINLEGNGVEPDLKTSSNQLAAAKKEMIRLLNRSL